MNLGLSLGLSRPVSRTVWNHADKNAAITLSGGSLRATGSGAGFQTARSTTSKSAGKWYFEATLEVVVGTATTGVGISVGGALPVYLGNGDGSTGIYASGGVYDNDVLTPLASMTVGDVMGVAVEIATGKVWFSKNGVWSGDPVAGTGNFTVTTGVPLFAGFCDADGGSVTVNFGATSFTTAPPTGFLAWNAA